MGELIGYADQITSYGFSSTDLGNKAMYVLSLGKDEHSANLFFRLGYDV